MLFSKNVFFFQAKYKAMEEEHKKKQSSSEGDVTASSSVTSLGSSSPAPKPVKAKNLKFKGEPKKPPG